MYMGRAKCFLTYSCPALAMRGVFVDFVALLTLNAVAKRCVLADLYTWFIYNTLYIRLKLAGSSHIFTKFMDAQRRTALFIFNSRRGLCVVYVCLGYKGPVTHTIEHVQCTKNQEFWSVRCDSLGVRQNSLMIWRERRMNVIHLLCASTFAHIFCMFKNVSVFPRVNLDARRTSDQRQSNARHK